MDLKKGLIFIGLLCGICLAFYFRDDFNITTLELLITDSGIFAPIFFMLLYFICTIILFPVSLLTLASGLLFGPWWGTLYSLIGATAGALAATALARYFLSDYIQNKSSSLVKKVIDGVDNEGWHFVAFVRLVPIFPFVFVNYAFGLTKINLIIYTVTNFICMLPGSFAYTYLGYLGKSAATDDAHQLVIKILICIAIFVSVIFLGKLIKNKRNKEVSDISEK